jgi:tetratricopeptide (TPR) repeat protein
MPVVKSAVAVLPILLTILASAQVTGRPTKAAPCPADRPVDDIIAEIHAQESKSKHRNSNPLPHNICIFGWCRNISKTPPTPPQQAQEGGTPSNDNKSSSSVSSSRTPAERCDDEMEKALEAAHDVDVGDFNFAETNYKGALMRYDDANEEKPEDAAIHLRLGKVFEKLNQAPQAIEQYNTVLKLAAPEKCSREAKVALLRLQPDSHP